MSMDFDLKGFEFASSVILKKASILGASHLRTIVCRLPGSPFFVVNISFGKEHYFGDSH